MGMAPLSLPLVFYVRNIISTGRGRRVGASERKPQLGAIKTFLQYDPTGFESAKQTFGLGLKCFCINFAAHKDLT